MLPFGSPNKTLTTIPQSQPRWYRAEVGLYSKKGIYLIICIIAELGILGYFWVLSIVPEYIFFTKLNLNFFGKFQRVFYSPNGNFYYLQHSIILMFIYYYYYYYRIPYSNRGVCCRKRFCHLPG